MSKSKRDLLYALADKIGGDHANRLRTSLKRKAPFDDALDRPLSDREFAVQLASLERDFKSKEEINRWDTPRGRIAIGLGKGAWVVLVVGVSFGFIIGIGYGGEWGHGLIVMFKICFIAAGTAAVVALGSLCVGISGWGASSLLISGIVFFFLLYMYIATH